MATKISKLPMNPLRRHGGQGEHFSNRLLALCLLMILAIGVSAQTQERDAAKPEAATPDAVSPQGQDSPPVAPDYRAPVRPLPSADRVGVDAVQQTTLTLRDAIAFALQNNNDIESSRIDVEMAEFDLRAARGVYDPRFTTESYFERRVTPVSSLIGGSRNGSLTQTDFTGLLRFSGLTPFAGGSYQLDFLSTRLTTDNQFVALNPQFPTALTLTFTQPLWRGLRIDDNRRRIEIAKKNLSLTDAQFRQSVTEVITRVEQAYWDLVFSLRNLQVQNDAVRQARRQLESNQRLVEQGILAPIDIVAAETQVTTFEQQVYSAEESVTRAENVLKTLMLPDRRAELWSRVLLPVTAVDLKPPGVTLEQAVTQALSNRPELDQLERMSEINQVNISYFKDQTKPQIDLVGSYSAVGLAGTVVTTQNPFTTGNLAIQERINQLSALAGLPPLEAPPPPAGISQDLIGGYGQSISNLASQSYPTARVSVRVGLPFRNRTAEANFGHSLAEKRRIENQRAQFEQIIEAEVRNSLQSVKSAEARLAAAASSSASAEQQYESEQRKFQAGTSTVFFVLQRQTDLIAARGRELQAQTDLNKAIAELRRATGRTLEANNISILREDRQLRLAPERADLVQGDNQDATKETARKILGESPGAP